MMKANNGMEQVEEEEEKCQIFFRQTDKCRSLSRLFVYYSLFFLFLQWHSVSDQTWLPLSNSLLKRAIGIYCCQHAKKLAEKSEDMRRKS